VTTILGRLRAPRRTGDEPFHSTGKPLGFSLLEFWRWNVSDLVSNATRGRLAEFLVAKALGGPETAVRDEWAAFDLETSDGIRIEVKSAAYLQSWNQRELSRISFGVRRTRAWDPDTNRQSNTLARQAHVYVFALLAHQDKSTLDPLNVDQWSFYVLPTRTLDAGTRSQHSITLKSLQKLSGAVPFARLRTAIHEAAARNDITRRFPQPGT
jgi:hypothetical protein